MAIAEDGSVLTGIFFKGGRRFRLSLSARSVSWKEEGAPENGAVLPFNQLIAVHPCDCTSHKSKLSRCHHCALRQYHLSPSLIEILPFHAKALKLHFAVPHRKCSWKLESHVFSPVESAVLKIWLCTIQRMLLELNRPKKLLVFVNPYGGKKKGRKIYERKVSPLLHLAGIDAHVIVTQRQNHAKEIAEEIDIYRFDGIVCVGGDGIFSEVLNGVLLKTQKEKSVDVNDVYGSLVAPRIPFGIIPAGSTNAAAFCAMGTEDPISATLLIIMGDSVGVDVCAVHHDGRLLRFAATFLSYGYFGDVILDSDQIRCLGPKRYELSGFRKILGRKIYSGELQLKVSTAMDQSTWELERCRVGCSVCAKAKEKSRNMDLTNSSSEKLRWITVNTQFMAVSAAILSCACGRTKDGMSPSQHIGNGYCDIIVVSATSRFDYIRYLLRTAYNYKSAFDLDYVQVYRVKEFMFSPYVTEDKTPDISCTGHQENWQQLKTSVWNCDGEVLREPSVYGKMHCQLVNIFGRGLEDQAHVLSPSNCFGLCGKGRAS